MPVSVSDVKMVAAPRIIPWKESRTFGNGMELPEHALQDPEIGISDPVIVETGYFKVTKRANDRYNHSGV